ncbi:acetylxylan esterase [Vibrio sp. JC009]|uniref:acetylxylan esterase n=1 Tax=Vibrio sp. JC009 TaxID=2912314 RepID=UPI0023B028C4|nr:acetylxylan esterase [Vibrio sp. JC009]WED23603.1 acetylxylan esterase [Vibrio sp. JC009]
MSGTFKHSYHFDPSYGHDAESLLKIKPGRAPAGFARFWQNKYQQALDVKPYLNIQDTGRIENGWRIFDCYFDSTDKMRIGGWLLLPVKGRVNGALIWTHGYGGIEEPDTSWKLSNTALLVPCIRGISRSACEPISSEPNWHVLHDIQDKEKYIIGGCVQDIWCSVSAMLSLFPQIEEHIGFCGSSFGGGLGIFATAFDSRINLSHFHVPTFGCPKVRMALPSVGSTESLREFETRHPELIAATLPYFDASCAAKHIKQPTHWALAMFDPFVAPPGQFSIYNACEDHKELYRLKAGHFDYRGEVKQRNELRQKLENYFSVLGGDDAS